MKIDGQKRHTREVMGDDPWSDHVSLLVYNLHADKVKDQHIFLLDNKLKSILYISSHDFTILQFIYCVKLLINKLSSSSYRYRFE